MRMPSRLLPSLQLEGPVAVLFKGRIGDCSNQIDGLGIRNRYYGCLRPVIEKALSAYWNGPVCASYPSQNYYQESYDFLN